VKWTEWFKPLIGWFKSPPIDAPPATMPSAPLPLADSFAARHSGLQASPAFRGYCRAIADNGALLYHGPLYLDAARSRVTSAPLVAIRPVIVARVMVDGSLLGHHCWHWPSFTEGPFAIAEGSQLIIEAQIEVSS
jgi:hypothetical protein